MLTIQISDQRLEKRIADKAQQIGQTVQDFVESLLSENLPNDDLRPNEEPIFVFQKLDHMKHGYIIRHELSEEELALIDDTPLFQHVTDSAKFAKELREKSWRTK
jgi:hypothetical protein